MIAFVARVRRPRPAPAATPPVRCDGTHPDAALTARPAGLSRTVVQQCQCGTVTGALEP